jgi:hypothetical protein
MESAGWGLIIVPRWVRDDSSRFAQPRSHRIAIGSDRLCIRWWELLGS